MSPSPKGLRPLEVVTFALLFGWLLAAALLVGIDYYDGYDAICNARYFLGRTESYVATRGPLYGALLVPSQWLQEQLGLHPLEVRVHHLVFALLHGAYLLGIYALLRRHFGRSYVTWAAFVAAVPTFVFFTYARTISHDLLPGLLFLGLLLGARSFMDRSSRGTWWALVLLGAAAPLIKHTYALFWIVILAVEAILLFPGTGTDGENRRHPDRLHRLRAFVGLAMAALGSGVITVAVLGFVLTGAYPELGFFERIARQVRFLLFEAGDQSSTQPIWVYLRNAPAFGVLTWVLVPLGLVTAWRGSRLQRAFALAWILCVVLIHAFSLRQVRYLAFLAPITAGLLIPAFEAILARLRGFKPESDPDPHVRSRRIVWIAAGLVWLLAWLPGTPYSIGTEAARIFDPAYRVSAARSFLEPLSRSGYEVRPIYINWGLLSFPAPGNAALAGDVYHEIYHLGPHHLVDLFPYEPEDIVTFDPGALARWQDWPTRSALITTTHGPVFNETTWERQPARNRAEQTQSLFLAQTLSIQTRPGSVWTTAGGSHLDVSASGTSSGPVLVLEGSDLDLDIHPATPMRAVVDGRSFPVRILAPGRWGIAGLDAAGLARNGIEFEIRFFGTASVHRNEDTRLPAGQSQDQPDLFRTPGS